MRAGKGTKISVFVESKCQMRRNRSDKFNILRLFILAIYVKFRDLYPVFVDRMHVIMFSQKLTGSLCYGFWSI